MATTMLATAEIAQGDGRSAELAEKVLPLVLALPSDIDIRIIRLGAECPSCDIAESADDFLLAFASDGVGRVSSDGASAGLTTRGAVVVGSGSCHIECQDGDRVLVLRLPRIAAQICASARHGGARRLIRGLLPIDLDRAAALQTALYSFGRGQGRREQAHAVLEGIVEALAAQHDVDTAFPPSRAISLARGWLDRDISGYLSHEELAGRAGITGVTLQRGFKAILGMTVTRYSQAVRLHDAQARLECIWECRSIAEIAAATGFSSSTAFARAYQKLFEETPTKTRTRVFRMVRGDHIDPL